ncbi:Ig-like protein [Leptospira inadai serovar Lyme str. 10]|uniref:Ig-like protein n=2 Tax=Leptospira inadai serovar Lyme TaxID=293084 RepID=V6HK43_9LEPT|nr:Ig-like domain-containing protein [Leptospira inadai]EQA37255.1 Ig-like protein [Leptospira inadai serovar Lyme str. 10]PNV76517.1 hypothetical protein BES34_002705 [Leptospira inadai serovar Lyme]
MKNSTSLYKLIFFNQSLYIMAIVIFLTSCKNLQNSLLKFDPFIGESDAPKVLFSNPVSGVQNLPSSQSFQIAFSKEMNMNACQIAFSMSPTTPGFFNNTPSVLNFLPSASLKAGTYTFSLTKSCEDNSGRDLKDPFSASVSVGSAANVGTNPTINNMYVYAGPLAACNAGTAALGDFLNSNIVTACMGNPNQNQIILNFSRAMNPQITQGAIAISPSLLGSYTWTSSSSLSIIPDYPLTAGQRYSVIVSTQAVDTSNIALAGNIAGSFFVGTNNALPGVTSITVFTGTIPTCKAGAGTLSDILSVAVTNGCLGNPGSNTLTFNFSTPMDPLSTQAAINISPAIPGTYTWSGGNTVLTLVSDSVLTYGTRYSVSISTSALSSNLVALKTPVTGSFVAGANNPSPHVQSIGVASQPGCATTLPGTGNAAGGSWTIGSCWWDDTISVLSPSSYQFRGGDDGTGTSTACADRTTDNFRLIFSNYMEPGSTLNAISLSRISPPLTTLRLSTWKWQDCQAVAPFGCRVLDLVYSEMEATCGTTTAFGTNGDFNLTNVSLSPPVSPNAPIYTIQVNSTSLDVNGKPLSPPFLFSFVSQ